MAVAEHARHTRPKGGDILYDETSDRRLADVFAPCFALILRLRSSDEFGELAVLRRRIKDLFDRCEREALGLGISHENVRAALFALVAFLDETVLASDWSARAHWVSQPLQLELYDRYDAGEVFFERLDQLLAQPVASAEALEVYYLCMTLGFKGKYQLHQQEQLHDYIQRTYDELRHTPGITATTLAPHGKPTDQIKAEVKSKLPAWVLVAAAVLIGVLFYLTLSLYVSGSAADAADAIRALTPEGAAP